MINAHFELHFSGIRANSCTSLEHASDLSFVDLCNWSTHSKHDGDHRKPHHQGEEIPWELDVDRHFNDRVKLNGNGGGRDETNDRSKNGRTNHYDVSFVDVNPHSLSPGHSNRSEDSILPDGIGYILCRSHEQKKESNCKRNDSDDSNKNVEDLGHTRETLHHIIFYQHYITVAYERVPDSIGNE